MCMCVCYLGVVKDNSAMRVFGGGGQAGWRHLWGDEHGLLLSPEVVLTEDEVGQMARKTTGVEDFHLTERK